MSTQLTRVNLLEVPLPADALANPCLPLVIMQPAADISNYMLKSNYATNGQPGVVDHALVADSVNAVDWTQLTNVPKTFPPAKHGATHQSNGTDPLPPATTTHSGTCPAGSGNATDYLGGDILFHAVPGVTRIRSEGQVSVSAGAASGTLLFTGTLPNPAPGIYIAEIPYLFDINPAFLPNAGSMVHFDVYDPALPGWVAATASTDLAQLTSQTALLRPILTSAIMTRVFQAAANSLTWRLVTDAIMPSQCFFSVGFSFFVTVKQSL